jgi:DDE superfamily endonuclease
MRVSDFVVAKEPAMLFSRLPTLVSTFFLALASWLDRRTAARLPAILTGALCARGRRTLTSWFRPAGITSDFRNAYTAVNSVGREAPHLAYHALKAVTPMLGKARLLVAIDDTPTSRYGPKVEGAGTHRHPSPGPADGAFLYGHVFVTIAALAHHPRDGVIALPLRADLYVRDKDVPRLPAERGRPFQTKHQLAAEQIRWLGIWAKGHHEELWAVVDGGYAARPFLDAARAAGFTVVARLRKDAALLTPAPPRLPGQKGRPRLYGKERISLAGRAAHAGGWQQVECEQYGQRVTKTVKTFLASWRPARGLVRVVVVKEDDGWLAFLCTKVEATAAEVLSAAADRNALEQGFKGVKEVWGAGEQQVRNVDSSVGCFNLNLWLMSIVEAWAWDKDVGELVDRGGSPWDSMARRPSHADKRKALQRETLRAEIKEALRGRPTREKMGALAERLLALAP